MLCPGAAGGKLGGQARGGRQCEALQLLIFGEESGVEPDECYVFGDVSGPERPDLAIEVVWTAGGINKLALYATLGVREVWFWRRGRLSVHVLGAGAYDEVPESQVLAGIDLSELASYLARPCW